MGMSLGTNSRQKAEINLTPMIDVLLVLIIIFLVISPRTSRGLDALVPQPSDSTSPTSPIVITVRADGSFRLNQESLDLPDLQVRLSTLLQPGTDQVLFLRGERDVDFGRIAQVIDLARGIGVYRVGLLTN